MKILRCRCNGILYYGTLEGKNVKLYDSAPFMSIVDNEKEIHFGACSATVPLADITMLAPCVPKKAVCVGLNYRAHANEFGNAIPSSPVLFIKPSTCLLNPGEKIVYPEMSKRLDFEGELVVVIGAVAKNVPASKAFQYVLGYTCGNDVTARDLQPKDGQWTVSKSFDTFMPLGPWIETDLDPANVRLKSFLNGELRQDSSTAHLIFSIQELIAYITRIMTLEPGDVIMTGTPSGVDSMQRGDTIRIEIEGIGALENTIE